jgi:hypothetical protein
MMWVSGSGRDSGSGHACRGWGYDLMTHVGGYSVHQDVGVSDTCNAIAVMCCCAPDHTVIGESL